MQIFPSSVSGVKSYITDCLTKLGYRSSSDNLPSQTPKFLIAQLWQEVSEDLLKRVDLKVLKVSCVQNYSLNFLSGKNKQKYYMCVYVYIFVYIHT